MNIVNQNKCFVIFRWRNLLALKVSMEQNGY